MKQKAFGVAMLAGMALTVIGPMVGMNRAAMPAQQFTLRIDNVSTENAFRPSNGTKAPATCGLVRMDRCASCLKRELPA